MERASVSLFVAMHLLNGYLSKLEQQKGFDPIKSTLRSSRICLPRPGAQHLPENILRLRKVIRKALVKILVPLHAFGSDGRTVSPRPLGILHSRLATKRAATHRRRRWLRADGAAQLGMSQRLLLRLKRGKQLALVHVHVAGR